MCIGKFQKISIPNHGRLPCFNLPLPSKLHYPSCPQNSIIMNPLLPFRISVYLEVHFRFSNACMNKRTWIYAFSRLWSLLFSDKKNLPLVVRLCRLLFKSEFGYKNKHHLRWFYSSLFSCVVSMFTKRNSSKLFGSHIYRWVFDPCCVLLHVYVM